MMSDDGSAVATASGAGRHRSHVELNRGGPHRYGDFGLTAWGRVWQAVGRGCFSRGSTGLSGGRGAGNRPAKRQQTCVAR
jgi:hypothetical protein